MPLIDLTRYVVASSGTWTDPGQEQSLFNLTRADTYSRDRLVLRWAGDFVALTGPLTVRVTVQAENMTVPLAYVGSLVPDAAATMRSASEADLTPGTAATRLQSLVMGRITAPRALGLQASTIYSYTLDIAAGQAWPFNLSEQLSVMRYLDARASHFEQLGNNLGFRVVIEPAFAAPECVPAAVSSSELPCDFAVANQPNSAKFFPSACEPCTGSVIGLPPSDAVTLVTPPAEGGCVRTRFFNGMFITREDLETEQRYHRVKSRLHNRAAGAGVVWGLGIGKRGSRVCVLPGYGVDCCGNDLALTSNYEVEIAALLADPAAAPLARQAGGHRMHLLLEYVECPSDPRPVHGDPCAAEASRCEMSRVRESVRLRLVPPRDYPVKPDVRPMARFLEEVRALRERYPIKTSGAPEQAGTDAYPFDLRLGGDFGGMTATRNLRPSSDLSIKDLAGFADGRPQRLTVELVANPLWTWVGGTQQGELLDAKGKAVDGVATPDVSTLSGGFPLRSVPVSFDLTGKRSSGTIRFKVMGWRAQQLFAGSDEPALGGDFSLTLRIMDGKIREFQANAGSLERFPIEREPAPCAGEPCTPRQGRDWEARDTACGAPGANFFQLKTDLTEHLARSSGGGGMKTLALAALGAWLAQAFVRERVGGPDEVSSARRELAQGVYHLAWKLLFGVSSRADALELGGAIQRLLQRLCNDVFWKGPQCCGDPHGVVVGCAVVEGGTIQSVDPFGGRRYVMHYPLIEHWLGQFDVPPPDLLIGRLFSKLCCVAGLPALGGEQHGKSYLIPFRRGYAVLGDWEGIDEETRARVRVVSQRRVGIPEMIVAALDLLGSHEVAPIERKKSDESERSVYTALVLDEIVAEGTVTLLTPVRE